MFTSGQIHLGKCINPLTPSNELNDATTINIYQPLRSGRIWHKVNFYAEFNRLEFRVFFLLD